MLFALLGSQYEGDDWQLAIVAMYASVPDHLHGDGLLAYRVPNAVTYPAIVGALLVGLFVPDAERPDVVPAACSLAACCSCRRC